MKHVVSTNKIYFFGFLLASAALLFDAYLQFYLTLPTCNLVYLERIILFVTVLAFLAGSLYHHTAASNRVFSLSSLLISLIGVGTALRHAWIQYFPQSQSFNLNPGNYTSKFTYISQWIQSTYSGTIACSQPQWSGYGITLTEWTFLLFIFHSVLALSQLRHKF